MGDIAIPNWTIEVIVRDLVYDRGYYRFRYYSKERAEAVCQALSDVMVAHRQRKNDVPTDIRVEDDFGWGTFLVEHLQVVRVLNQVEWDRTETARGNNLKREFPAMFTGPEIKDTNNG